MEFAKIKKAAILLMSGIIISSFASVSSAAVTWLSSINNTAAPSGVAVDGKGNIYILESRSLDRVLVFDPNGNHVRTVTGLNKPTSIAVDAMFRLIVANSGSGSVSVYNSDFSFAFKLGKGDGEFKYPTGVAASASGSIYVSDRKANTVRIYSQDGSFVSDCKAQFTRPLGVAVDDSKGEVFVVDRPSMPDPMRANTPMTGARVQVFDLAGNYVRNFGTYGVNPGQMMSPVGIATDGAGTVYITDGGIAPQAIHAMTNTGAWIQTISDSTHAFKVPVGVAVGKDKRMVVASLNGPAVDVFGLDGYTTLAVSPAGPLTFTAQEGGASPSSQEISIANSGSGSLAWTAAVSTIGGGAWLSAPASGTVAPASSSAVSVAVNSSGLAAGTYTGSIVIAAASGAEQTVSVQLTVTPPPAILSITPNVLNLKAQQGGSAPLPQSFTISNAGTGDMTWTASSTEPRITLSASSSFLTVTVNTDGLAAGTYTYPVAITAPGAQASPANVSVTLDVVYAGKIKVTSNLADASFDISGAASLNGSGKSWTGEDVLPGDYTITFDRVPGYLKPVTRNFTVASGQEVAITADYRVKRVPTHVIAGSVKNGLVTIQPLNGGEAGSFMPFGKHARVRVAAGDLDGSGIDKIVVTNSFRAVKVVSMDGVELAAYQLAESLNKADVTVGDLDNDGIAEILIMAESDTAPRRVAKVFTLAGNTLVEKAGFSEDKKGDFAVALADINDDGMLEILVVDSNTVRAFSLRPADLSLGMLWTKSGDFGRDPQIAAGDLNNDGKAEIAISHDWVREAKGRNKKNGKGTVVSFLNGTGEEYGLTVEPFEDLGGERASTIAMGDVDADGLDELVAGTGPAEGNDPLIRIFESDGTYAGVTMKPMNGKFGVNVGLGTFQQ